MEQQEIRLDLQQVQHEQHGQRDVRLDDRARRTPGGCSERVSGVFGKIGRAYCAGLPGAVLAVALAALFGTKIRGEVCHFVRSPECVVVYLPEHFTCDFSYVMYAQGIRGTSVHFAKKKTETSIARADMLLNAEINKTVLHCSGHGKYYHEMV